MLLIYTFKKVFNKFSSFEMKTAIKMLVFKIKYIIPFFLLSNTSLNNADTDVKKISFSIIKKDSCIGFIDIEKTSIDEITTYIINSEVKAKVIFIFNAVGIEKYIYKSDTLIYSSLYRKLNNKVKLNQTLSLVEGKYFLKEKNRIEALDFHIINRNLVTLFFIEPIGIHEVYSDKYREMVRITPMDKGKYRVVLPNKSTNIYHYENGVCTLIEVTGTFFKVKLIPTF